MSAAAREARVSAVLRWMFVRVAGITLLVGTVFGWYSCWVSSKESAKSAAAREWCQRNQDKQLYNCFMMKGVK